MSIEYNIYLFTYKKNSFEVDEKNLTVLKNGKRLNLTRQQFEILLQFLKAPETLITRTQFSDEIWKDAGVSDATLNKEISLIRKEFGDKNEIILTIPKSRNNQKPNKEGGYKFNLKVEIKKLETVTEHENKKVSEVFSVEPQLKPTSENNRLENNTDYSEPEDNVKNVNFLHYSSLKSKPILIFTAIVTFLIVGVGGLKLFSESDEDKIRRVVKESQLYESLILYKNPLSFSENNLDNYWTPELEITSNYDRQRIRDSVTKLQNEKKRYGEETKCEQFEFQSVEITKSNDFAVVKTLEKWFISVYSIDGVLQKNRRVGPYFVSYALRKIDGRWLIEKSNTGRINRPTPRLFDIKILSGAKPKTQFYIKITGQDFEPENIFIEVSGKDCPETKPCSVPNNVLRETSKLTETVLDDVPLTLDSGDFKITARNGDSKASNSINISIP
jgi:DNA-binding winged helix-turn-helix (wHTH) protein